MGINVNIEKKDLNSLLNSFYNYYFVDCLEEVISDKNEEYSSVLLMEVFIFLLN